MHWILNFHYQCKYFEIAFLKAMYKHLRESCSNIHLLTIGKYRQYINLPQQFSKYKHHDSAYTWSQ